MNKLLLAGLVTFVLAAAIAPAAFAKTNGTGTLFMYTDSTCTTLLPQSGGTMGYVLPATGTVIGIKVTGITEVADGGITILLQFTGEPNEFLSGTVSGGTTNCIAWTVGEFGGTVQDTPSGCATGNVNYGPADDTTVSDFFFTASNGGSDGGHFFWGTDCGGTTTTTSTTSGGCTENCPPPVPEFPVGLLPVLAIAIPVLVLLRRRLSIPASG